MSPVLAVRGGARAAFMHTLKLARHAMATRFEVVLNGKDPVALRAAGEEALDEVTRLEGRLSLYQPGSEIAQINARGATEAVRVSPEVFQLLRLAIRLSEETDGAFDITVAPLVRCWGLMGGTARIPTKPEIASALELVGTQHVLLDERSGTVRLARDGVMVDLGAIGKGFALERADVILREAGVESALIHGGTSSVCAIGRPLEADYWTVAIERSRLDQGLQTIMLPEFHLRDEAMSVSATEGRRYTVEDKTVGHVLDPRTGQPVASALIAALALPSATEADALSTALLTMGWNGASKVTKNRKSARALLISRDEDGFQVRTRGLSQEEQPI